MEFINTTLVFNWIKIKNMNNNKEFYNIYFAWTWVSFEQFEEDLKNISQEDIDELYREEEEDNPICFTYERQKLFEECKNIKYESNLHKKIKKDFPEITEEKKWILFYMYSLIQSKLRNGKIQEMIKYLEWLLKELPYNPFHEYIWMDFWKDYEEINQTIKKLITTYPETTYIYTEINGFTINYWWDLYFEIYSWDWYKKYDKSLLDKNLFDDNNCLLKEYDWTLQSCGLIFWNYKKLKQQKTELEEYEDYYESLFSDYFDNISDYGCDLLNDSAWICELLVILRLNEYIIKVSKEKLINKNIPIYVNAHDYDFINKIDY